MREALKVVDGRFVHTSTNHTFASRKEAQVFAWSTFCAREQLSDEEREAIKETIFDEVARREAITMFADVWGVGER